MAAEKFGDLSQPIDVSLLDANVAAFYGTGSKEERSAADQILQEMQINPDMWLQVMHTLQNTKNLNTKFFALQDNQDLYAEEAAAQREIERQRMLAIPGLVAPSELQDEMLDS